MKCVQQLIVNVTNGARKEHSLLKARRVRHRGKPVPKLMEAAAPSVGLLLRGGDYTTNIREQSRQKDEFQKEKI